MNVIDAIYHELREAQAAMLDVKRVRVSVDALRGSVVTVPLSRDGIEEFGGIVKFATPSGVLVQHPSSQSESWREVLIHPFDWDEARKSHHAVLGAIEPTQAWGLPVVHS